VRFAERIELSSNDFGFNVAHSQYMYGDCSEGICLLWYAYKTVHSCKLPFPLCTERILYTYIHTYTYICTVYTHRLHFNLATSASRLSTMKDNHFSIAPQAATFSPLFSPLSIRHSLNSDKSLAFSIQQQITNFGGN